jgi:kinesin family protein C2/C3
VPDNPGINQRALLELFTIIKQRQLDWDFTVVVSVLEVYNESIRDLLAVNHTEKMDVKQGPDGVYVPGLTQVSVTCLEEVNEVRRCKSLNYYQKPDLYLNIRYCILQVNSHASF